MCSIIKCWYMGFITLPQNQTCAISLMHHSNIGTVIWPRITDNTRGHFQSVPRTNSSTETGPYVAAGGRVCSVWGHLLLGDLGSLEETISLFNLEQRSWYIWPNTLDSGTYKSWEVIVDAVLCQPFAELRLFPQELLGQLVDLFFRVFLVVACNGGMRGFTELLLGTHKQLLVHFLWWDHVTWGRKKKGSRRV